LMAQQIIFFAFSRKHGTPKVEATKRHPVGHLQLLYP
jgi:hypothetical protein